MNGAAVHLVFETLHRWAGEMPSQPAGSCKFVRHVAYRVMKIMHGIGLHGGRVAPAETETAKTLFHDTDDMRNLFGNRIGDRFSETNDAIAIEFIVRLRWPRLGAAGDEATGGRFVCSWNHIGKGIAFLIIPMSYRLACANAVRPVISAIPVLCWPKRNGR